MKSLIVIDYMYTMHRHMYAIKENEKKKGGQPTMTNPHTGEESARVYFSLRDIEAILQKHEGSDVIICMDRKSKRKELETTGTDYKANRSEDRFTDLDSAAIKNITNLLARVASVLYADGYEADDIIHGVVTTYHDEYDQILIYTPDSDLAVLIDDKVSLMRYKSVYSKAGLYGQGAHAGFLDAHALVTKDNYCTYFSEEYSKKGPVTIDYNSIMLYKVTVGDVADNIKGIKGFGNAAYKKLRDRLVADGFGHLLANANTAQNVTAILNSLIDTYLTADQVQQAKLALSLVQPMLICVSPTAARKPLDLPTRKQIYENTWGIKKI